jgi:molybdenum cofactor cytidylyltransferase
MTSSAVAVVPAAGRSERFGSPKLLADIDGEPLINHTLRCLIEAGVDEIVLVTSSTMSLGGASMVRDPRVRLSVNPDPSRGMFSSIQTGLAEADRDDILILPADMPFVRSETVSVILAECRSIGSVVVPVYKAQRGHPLALPGRLRDQLIRSDSHRSLKEALASINAPSRELAVNDPGIVRDVDVTEDLTNR